LMEDQQFGMMQFSGGLEIDEQNKTDFSYKVHITLPPKATTTRATTTQSISIKNSTGIKDCYLPSKVHEVVFAHNAFANELGRRGWLVSTFTQDEWPNLISIVDSYLLLDYEISSGTDSTYSSDGPVSTTFHQQTPHGKSSASASASASGSKNTSSSSSPVQEEMLTNRLKRSREKSSSADSLINKKNTGTSNIDFSTMCLSYETSLCMGMVFRTVVSPTTAEILGIPRSRSDSDDYAQESSDDDDSIGGGNSGGGNSGGSSNKGGRGAWSEDMKAMEKGEGEGEGGGEGEGERKKGQTNSDEDDENDYLFGGMDFEGAEVEVTGFVAAGDTTAVSEWNGACALVPDIEPGLMINSRFVLGQEVEISCPATPAELAAPLGIWGRDRGSDVCLSLYPQDLREGIWFQGWCFARVLCTLIPPATEMFYKILDQKGICSMLGLRSFKNLTTTVTKVQQMSSDCNTIPWTDHRVLAALENVLVRYQCHTSPNSSSTTDDEGVKGLSSSLMYLSYFENDEDKSIMNACPPSRAVDQTKYIVVGHAGMISQDIMKHLVILPSVFHDFSFVVVG
jgi:hypothetical protein